MMGWYMGDYYAGSRGDPGIGSFFGGLLGMGASLIPGGGAVTKGISLAARAATAGRGIVKAGKGVIMKHPAMTAAGAAGIVGLGVGAGAERMLAGGGACPRGFHISRSKHSHKLGQCVRNRHMNPCNPRALRRSIRRAHAFAKFAMKAIHLTMPKKKCCLGGFNKKKKK